MTYFAAGETARGAASVAMQASLVLWPATYRMACAYAEAQAVDEMLNELSVTYRVPASEFETRKRFQPGAGIMGAKDVRQPA
jgi:hypothetical protein